MSLVLKESGWYLARRRLSPSDLAPTVVRVTLDEDGGVTTVWEIGRRDPSPVADWQLVGKIHISGRVTDLELDAAQKEAHADGVRQGWAEAEQAQREREHANPVFSADMPQFDGADLFAGSGEFREIGEAMIAVRMTASYAETVSHGLSDLLCWSRGFCAALPPDDSSRAPMGIEWVRRLRETLQSAQRAAEKKKEPQQ